MDGIARKRKRESDVNEVVAMFDFIRKYKGDPEDVRIEVTDFKVTGFKVYSTR